MSSSPKVVPNVMLTPIPALSRAPAALVPIPERRAPAKPSESLESRSQRQRRETSSNLTGSQAGRAGTALPAPSGSRAPQAAPQGGQEVRRVAPAVDATARFELQTRIRELAFNEIGSVNYSARGSDGGPRGWQHLQEIFEQSTGYRPPDSQIRSTAHPGGIQWCGMFATYVWQNAGINTRWAWGQGPQGNEVMSLWPYNFRNRRDFEDSVQVGDILIGPGPNWHHSLVVSVDDGVITTVDGNTVALNPAGETGRTVITEPLADNPSDLPVPQGPLSHGIALRSHYDRSRIQRIIRPRALHQP